MAGKPYVRDLDPDFQNFLHHFILDPDMEMEIVLPKDFEFLKNETQIPLIREMLKISGTKEAPGDGDNPVILEWAKELGLENLYKHDEQPWCGLTIAIVTKRAGYEPVKDPLWALNWAKFGQKVEKAGLGSILVFRRYNHLGQLIGGHVGQYAAEDQLDYWVWGGNERDMVTIVPVRKDRLEAIVVPAGGPAAGRQVYVSTEGKLISTNEA